MSPTTSPSHRPTSLFFITGNANKLAEVRAILADTGVELSSKALDLPELQGGIEEISRDKCRRAAEAVSFAFVVSESVRVCKCVRGGGGGSDDGDVRKRVDGKIRSEVVISCHCNLCDTGDWPDRAGELKESSGRSDTVCPGH